MVRRAVVLFLVALSLPLWATGPGGATTAPPKPEGLADRMCDTPQNLTGLVQLGASGDSWFPTSIVWDGAAYGIAYSMNTYIYFCRVAADGTRLAGPVQVGGNGAGAYNPSIAWTGTEYGVAWEDYRDNGEIYFARVNATGVKQGADVRVTNDASDSMFPSLAWSGTEYGVAWEDSRNGGREIFFARLSAAGVKQGSDVRVTTLGNTGRSEYPSMVWNGVGYAVAWEDSRNSNQRIYFNTISSTGAVGSESCLVWAEQPSWAAFPSLCWTGSRYGLVWVDHRDGGEHTYFKQFEAPWASTNEIPLTTLSGHWPDIVWTGAEYGVAWWRDGGIDYVRVSESAVKLPGEVRIPGTDIPRIAYGTMGFGVALTFGDVWGEDVAAFVGLGCHADTTAPQCPTNLTVTANSGSGVTLNWMAGVDVETEMAYHRVYRNNSPIATVTTTTYTDSPRPSGTPTYEVRAVNANGRESYACATATVPIPAGDCGRVLTGETPLSQTIGTASVPAVAWSGREYGVAWQDNRDGNAEIYFARMAADGTKLGSDVRVTSDTANSSTPSIVWTGTEYGLAWHDNRPGNYEIYFTRLSADGVKQGSDVRITTDVSTGYSSLSPSLAWAGTEYGVAWEDQRDGNYEIYFARVSAAGVKQGSDVRITADVSTGYISSYCSLAWTGNEYGVAWNDYRDGNGEIYFARISAAGVKQGSDVRVTTAAADSLYPSLAWSGAEYGVAWQDARDGNREIYFARLSAPGAVQGGDVRVTNAAGDGFYPALAWTGSEYEAVWRDDRSGNGEIYYGSLTTTGGLLTETRLTATSAIEYYPALAVGGHGLGVVYTRDLTQDLVLFRGLGCGAADLTPPECPGALSETYRTTNRLTLGWTPSLEPDSDLGVYTVYRNTSAVGATTATSWMDVGFDPAAGYVYSVVATNAEGLFSTGCAVLDSGDTVPPTCPENLLASDVTQTSATLHWLPSQDAKSGLSVYKIYRNSAFLEDWPFGSPYIDSTLTANTTYNYAVRAVDCAGNVSTGCTTASVYISTAPITLFLTKNADMINADLDWNDVDLNEYVVYRSTSPQTASELKRVPLDQTQDPVLQDGVGLWFYYIQQRE